jgi:hypothetical protein
VPPGRNIFNRSLEPAKVFGHGNPWELKMKRALLLVLALVLLLSISCAVKDPTGLYTQAQGAMLSKQYDMALIYASMHGKGTVEDLSKQLYHELGRKRACMEIKKAHVRISKENIEMNFQGAMTQGHDTGDARRWIKQIRFNMCN